MSDLPAGYEKFSPEARRGQLIEFAFLCRTLAEEFESHTERFSAELHAAAQEAERLRDEGYDQESLTRLAEMFPPDPVWMHPKALDAGMPLEGWRGEAAPQFSRARELAVRLRTIAERRQ